MRITRYSRYAEENRKRNERRDILLLGVAIVIMLVLVVFVWRGMSAQECRYDFPNGETPFGVSVAELMDVRIPEDVPAVSKEYSAMLVNFNPECHVPNYVAWELTKHETRGSISRRNDFCADDEVEGCATLDDYRGSGYQRGHMMPAGDAKYDSRAMKETFFLTNMCPQVGALNAGAWSRLEEKCRQWANVDSAVIIIAGPVLTDRITDRIGESGVVVPRRFFKVILSPYADPPRAIGFIMPNAKVPGGMQTAAVSVDEVERVTGLDFFSALPDDIENMVESKCEFLYWSTLK